MQKIYQNGELLKEKSHSALNHLGFGVFETFLAKAENRSEFVILGLAQHFERLKDGCSKLGLSFLKEERYVELISQALREADASLDRRIRIIIYPNDWYLQLEPYLVNSESISVKCVRMDRALPEVKSCSAITSVYSANVAVKEGFDEALLLNQYNMLRETSWGNFFFVSAKNELCTPGSEVLRGVTRGIVLELAARYVKVLENNYNIEELQGAKACFSSRSTNGVNKIHRIDSQVYPDSELLEQISRDYQELYIVPGVYYNKFS